MTPAGFSTHDAAQFADYEGAREYMEGIIFHPGYTYVYVDLALRKVRQLTDRVEAVASTLTKEYLPLAQSGPWDEIGTFTGTTPATAHEFEGTGVFLEEGETFGGISWDGGLAVLPVNWDKLLRKTAAADGDTSTSATHIDAPELPSAVVSGTPRLGHTATREILISNSDVSVSINVIFYRQRGAAATTGLRQSGQEIADLLDGLLGLTWRGTGISGNALITAIDNATGSTDWRSGGATQRTAQQVVDLLDTHFGNTDWRTQFTTDEATDAAGALLATLSQFTYDSANDTLTFTETGTDLSWDRTATTLTVRSDTGADATLPAATGTPARAGIFTGAEAAKLAGIAAGAQVNPTGDQIVNLLETLAGLARLDAEAIQAIADQIDVELGSTTWRTGGGGGGVGGAGFQPANLFSGDIAITTSDQWVAAGTTPVPSDAEWILFNGGKIADAVDDAPNADWKWINAADWRLLVAAAAGDSFADGSGMPFAEWVIGDIGSPSFARRDVLIGRTATNTVLIASRDDDEDFAGAQIKYVTATSGSTGFALRFAAGAPADSLGDDGDWYLNTTDGSWFTKSSGAWGSAVFTGGSGGGVTLDEARDAAGAILAALSQFTYDDAANTLTFTHPTNLASAAGPSVRSITSNTGADASIPSATATVAGWMSAADKAKLDGIAGAVVTDDIYFGTSADAIPTGAELTIPAVAGVGTITMYAGERHHLIARLATEADITRVVYSDDVSGTNQVGAFTKYASTVVPTGETEAYNVWVSNQPLEQAADVEITVS